MKMQSEAQSLLDFLGLFLQRKYYHPQSQRLKSMDDTCFDWPI